jgi:hypothetical protein
MARVFDESRDPVSPRARVVDATTTSYDARAIRSRGARGRARARAIVSRLASVAGAGAGGRIAGVRTWRVARPPATFLGATAETRVPLKADLFAPTRAGLTAAIDMVTAAIAKSGVTCRW